MELAPENEKVQEQAMKIIEKCDFGDLSRQRLIKVVSHLDNIETRLTKLFDALKMQRKEPTENKCKDGASLSGPQLSADAPSQDDIDAIFDSF
jgi:chemotaxis regulatin CheY-phosphate phosphatase CheZ